MSTDHSAQQSMFSQSLRCSNQEEIMGDSANPVTSGPEDSDRVDLRAIPTLDIGLEILRRAANANIPGISQFASEQLQNMERLRNLMAQKGDFMLPPITGAERHGDEDLIRGMKAVRTQGLLYELDRQRTWPVSEVNEMQNHQEDLVQSMEELTVRDSRHVIELQQPLLLEGKTRIQNLEPLAAISPSMNGGKQRTPPDIEGMFTLDLIHYVVDTLEDILRPKYTYADFMRDFGQWFDPDDHYVSSTPVNLQAENIGSERDFRQWLSPGDTTAESGNVQVGDINFERDFEQWFNYDDATTSMKKLQNPSQNGARKRILCHALAPE
ncbi:hypothetical protein C0993_006236 [Termitomyces sp. T159_Od127]|nr:hypothetical protein C0993_006236 [Termitomyces sp. T159_Od127]